MAIGESEMCRKQHQLTVGVRSATKTTTSQITPLQIEIYRSVESTAVAEKRYYSALPGSTGGVPKPMHHHHDDACGTDQ
jgi:hypothetical protein